MTYVEIIDLSFLFFRFIIVGYEKNMGKNCAEGEKKVGVNQKQEKFKGWSGSKTRKTLYDPLFFNQYFG